jgi:hypothetical protein
MVGSEGGQGVDVVECRVGLLRVEGGGEIRLADGFKVGCDGF